MANYIEYMGEIDFSTIIYILFLVLYGIYSLYKKSMQDAEKKYSQPAEKVPDSRPNKKNKRESDTQKQPAPSARDIWEELMGEKTTGKTSSEKQVAPTKKIHTLPRKAISEEVIKESTKRKPVASEGSHIPARPSISEHSSFLPGDFVVAQMQVPEEGVPVFNKQGDTEGIKSSQAQYHGLPDDFDPRVAFMYAVLLERKVF